MFVFTSQRTTLTHSPGTFVKPRTNNKRDETRRRTRRRRATTRRRVTRRGCSHGTPQPIAGVAPAPAASLELNGGKCEKFLLQRCESLLISICIIFSNIFPCPFHFPLIFLEIPGSKNKKQTLVRTKQGKTCSGPAIRCHKTRKNQLLLLR